MPIFPVFAPAGTVAVTWVSEFTVKLFAVTPAKVNSEVCCKLTPVTTTLVPTGPLEGAKLRICGVTRKILSLVRLPPDVVTAMLPVVAPVGTVVVR